MIKFFGLIWILLLGFSMPSWADDGSAATVQTTDPNAALLKSFAQQARLYFFYTSTCPYCHKFAPILKSFADRYGITVDAITLNGEFLPSFPNAKVDDGQSAWFNVRGVPALYTIEPKTQQAVTVGLGLMTEEGLEQNIVNIEKQFQMMEDSGS